MDLHINKVFDINLHLDSGSLQCKFKLGHKEKRDSYGP